MRRLLITSIAILGLQFCIHSQTGWEMQSAPLQTRWAKQVSPSNALPEYPRPQMVRGNWQNLNGLWQYAITDKDQNEPLKFDGQILVPYPIESALSGVKKMVQPTQNLWYKKTFNQPALKNGERVLLHFGAVDWQATVSINNKEIGRHTGGYDNFSFDITDALKNGKNEIVVKVFDPTDQGPNPHGKQVLNPQNIWYTPTTGIWQTVWLETVPKSYVESLKITPHIDKPGLEKSVPASVSIDVSIKGELSDYEIEANSNGVAIKSPVESRTQRIELPVKNVHLWSPEDPFLYTLSIKLLYKGKPIDEVTSYFGMRKVEIKKDGQGNDRIFLNNRYIFNVGVLDQGFWPDGIYTAPTDEALAFDIKAIKAMGFNTIRKHIKREPDRWYYWCDKLGMMVWQDMINPSFNLDAEAKKVFGSECKETIEELYNHPSITTYTLFNEKWGQYDQQQLSEWIKKLDPTRLLNGHSGEILYVNEKLRSPSPNAWVSSDLTDIHSYPDPMNSPQMNGKGRVLGEFGGIGVFIPDHQWNANSAWGYINVTPAALKGKYTVMTQHLKLLEKDGLTASIYTQPFDVEGEQNGLMTYDREVVKIPIEDLRKIHSLLNPSLLSQKSPQVKVQTPDLTEPTQLYAAMVQQYLNGKHDPVLLKKLAIMAGQTNDAAGKNRFGAEYLATLKKPYSADDIAFMEGSTKKTTDAAFGLLLARLDELNGKEQRALHEKLMRIIYQDVIASYVPNAQAKPDWNEVAEKIKAYGAPGEEIYLRAKTIHTMNQQDWAAFKPTAKQYLEKYGAYIKADEKKLFEEKL